MQYTPDQLIRLAKRDNNKIRPYLFVNPLQGKHIPADPGDVIGLCRSIAAKINGLYPDELLYVIGFAETATGIASCITSYLKNAVYYQSTTREHNGEKCILFSETHSHATEQLLREEGIEDALKSVDRVVFIDDEVTTGNTILNLISMIKDRCHDTDLHYSVVSIINSMPEGRIDELFQQDIDCVYLVHIPFEYKKESIIDIEFAPENHITVRDDCETKPDMEFVCSVNSRNIVPVSNYISAVGRFAEEIRTCLPDGGKCMDKVLVLGTEEFMYPTFVVGEMIQQHGRAKTVKIHSTTRSPIIASNKAGYPLRRRYQIRSPYDSERTTYIYNLDRYDKVFVLTDAPDHSAGLNDLRKALELSGNMDISVVRWKYTEGGEVI